MKGSTRVYVLPKPNAYCQSGEDRTFRDCLADLAQAVEGMG